MIFQLIHFAENEIPILWLNRLLLSMNNTTYVPQKPKNRSSIRFNYPTSGYAFRRYQIITKDMSALPIIIALFSKIKLESIIKGQMPVNGWKDKKMWNICTNFLYLCYQQQSFHNVVHCGPIKYTSCIPMWPHVYHCILNSRQSVAHVKHLANAWLINYQI